MAASGPPAHAARRQDSTTKERPVDVHANGTTLYAEQTGEGPSVLFVHGMCGDARVWAGQVDRLADRFRCTTYDRRGHTRSPRTDVTETVELHADDLAALITALDLP